MTDKPKLKSDNSFKIYFIILLLGGIGFSFLCYYLISSSLSGPYPQIVGIILGIFFGIFGLLCLISLNSFDSILIYSDRVVVKSILGYIKKTIYFSDITSWTEIPKQNNSSKWLELTIFTERTKYKLSSSIYNNYSHLKRTIVKDKQRNLIKQRNWSRRNNLYYAIGTSLFGILCLFAAYHFYITKDDEIQYTNIHSITDVITNKPEIIKGSKGSRDIHIKLKSWPEFIFQISGNSYEATYTSDYIEYVKVGDTLSLDIMKDEYEMKLSKEKPLGFWDKTVNYQFIPVYGFKDRNRSYLTISDYNTQNRSDTSIGIWFFGIGGLFLFGYGFVLLKKEDPSR